MKREISTNGFGLGLLFILMVVFFALPGWAASGRAGNLTNDGIALRWGNQTIANEDIDVRIKSLPPELQQQLKDPKQMHNYLDSLMQIKMVGAEARADGLDRQKRIAIRISDAVDSILLQEYMNSKIKLLPPPTEAQARAYYEKHKGEFLTPAFVRAHHILIESKPDAGPEDVSRAKTKAQKIYDELAVGGDFETLARQFSDDEENKDKGGDMGLFQAEQMVPEFSGPVFKMKKGELCKPFLSPFGFHIVRLDDYIPAKQREFKEVADDVKVQADNENREKLIQSELARLKKKYKAVIVEKKK